MSGRHATSAELELYVLGALDPARVEAFEAHCAACPSCAAALTGEARLEMAFEQVGKRSLRGSVLRPLRAAAYGAAGLLTMAAAVFLVIGRAPASATGEGTAATSHHPMDDGAILDARNDALDGG
jgi:anti-sigma factor RsiW